MTRLSTACALALALALSAATAARAQVAVLRIDPEAEAVCRDVEAALQGVGVVPDPGYLNEARQQDVDPASDSALELITPLLQLKLAVVPMSVDDTSIEVEYRDGRTGARLGTARIPREQGKLGARGREQLRSDVVGHLGAVIEGNAAPAADESEGEESVEQEEPGDDAPRTIEARVHAGVGVGMRDVEWTRGGQAERVELGAFPAVDLGLSLSFRLSEGLSLVPALAYQSSLFFQEVEEPRMAAPSEKTAVRAHRFAATVGLELRLGGARSLSITPALGLGVRNLRPEVHHLSTPAYSLAGPLAVIGIFVPLGDSVALRIAPEAQYVFVGEGLREREVESTGLSLGGEASIAIELLEPLALELAYREAHALLTSLDGTAGDVERFITLRAVGKL
jgi:hypothetical protein